jgi:hypothetical protein
LLFQGVPVKTFVYVDAFNLYFGCCRGTPFKWLDISKLCGFLLPGHTVERIKYFTARIHPRPGDPGQPMRQLMYLRALQTLPSIEIYFGHFLTHPTFMPLVHPSPGQNSYAEVFKTEEKGSDVNLATHLIHDAHLNRFEQAVVISGDSDLGCPVQIVIQELHKPVGVLNPQKQDCVVLLKQATFYKRIRKGVLSASQFPLSLTDAQGTFSKPPTW